MIRTATLKSLAKVNLDLRVLYRRPDRFHELRTVFQSISLSDAIHIEYEPSRRTELSIDDALNIADNLILRAATLVLDRVKVRARVKFRLRKSIPMGGGFGGGSSNAAAVLLALPVLAGRRVDLAELIELGSTLGSDVPFFLMGGTALGIGRGTELYSLPEIREQPMLIAASGVHVSTPEAYGALKRPLLLAEMPAHSAENELTVTAWLSRLRAFQTFTRVLGDVRSAADAGKYCGNDFEDAVFDRHPELKRIYQRLKRTGAGMVRMTGSGSGVFGVFESAAARELARRSCEYGRGTEACQWFAAKLVSQRSYRALWRRQLKDHIDQNSSSRSEQAWPPHSKYASRSA